MKTVTIILGVFLVGITSMTAQFWGNEKIKGNGEVISKTRNVSDYDEILVAGNMDVSLVSGKEGELTISGESNLIPYLLTEVSGGALKIYIEKGYNLRTSLNENLIVTVPFTHLEKVKLSGSGDVYSESTIKTDDFSTSLSGSGEIKLKIEASEVFVNVTGSGSIEMQGGTENLECKLTGSGDLKAYDLTAQKANVSVTGSGDVKIMVSEDLTARVTGSGDIKYKGNPKKEDKKTTGSGDITSI